MPFGSITSCCCGGTPGHLCGTCLITATSGTLTLQGWTPPTCADPTNSFFTGANDMIAMTTAPNAVSAVTGPPSLLFGSDWILNDNGCGAPQSGWVQFIISCSNARISLAYAFTTTPDHVRPARTAVVGGFDIPTSLQSGIALTTVCSPFSATFDRGTGFFFTSASFG